MSWEHLLLYATAALSGAINAVAGGGTLLTFPLLFALLGRHPLYAANSGPLANATSTVALFPGTLAAIAGYRQEIREARHWLWLLAVPSLIGGWVGARLLTSNSAKSFEQLVPLLILTAAVLFALQPRIARWTGIGTPHASPTLRRQVVIVLFQTGVAVYGGYFGAGIGILMLAALAMMGMADLHQMNGVKSVLAGLINGIAAVEFVLSDYVVWDLALPMAVSALIGGYVAASVARRLNRELVRRVVIAIGFALAAFYIYTHYLRP